jgi:hypothetical protein
MYMEDARSATIASIKNTNSVRTTHVAGLVHFQNQSQSISFEGCPSLLGMLDRAAGLIESFNLWSLQNPKPKTALDY